MIHFHRGDVMRAIAMLRRVVSAETFPKAEHEFHLAVALAKAGDLEESLEHFERAKAYGIPEQLWSESDAKLAGWLAKQLKAVEEKS